MTPCGLFWQAKAQSTVEQKPASIAMTAVWIMPMAVAPPMSMVEQKEGVRPRKAATREAQPCCSPITAGIRARTPSIASRATPQSSIARLAAPSVKPIVPVPEGAGVAGVARELVVGMHGVGIARGGGVRLQVLARDRALHEGRQLLPHRNRLGIEAWNHVLREMSVLREKKTGCPAASTASVSSTAKSSMPFEPCFS